MSKKTTNYKRIAKNTVMLYFRMLLIMVISLYTVRILLSALGQQDYGLYNVIGGIVVMFSFLTHVLSSASQRFFAFDIGKGNYKELSKTYSAVLLLYGAVAVLIILLAESLGLWFLHNKMTIPQERMYAADWVYQFSIMAFCWKVFTSPHQAIIIAHEDMNIYAYVGILEILLQLALVFMLLHVSQDRLIVYAVLMFLIIFFVNSIYILYARFKYKQIRFTLLWDKDLIKRVVSYSGWTLFGALGSLVRSHGINIILNVYFAPVINAARGIAHNVNSAVGSFSGNFYTAVKPQIVKCYAQGDYDSCYKLVFRSTRFSFCLLLVLALPVFCYTPEILTLWLNDYPDYTVIFTRLILVVALIDSLANPLITFNQATGNIKLFQIAVSLINISNLPIAIAVFEIGAGPVAVFWVSIVISIVGIIARLIIINRQHHFPLLSYFKHVLIQIILVITCSVAVMYVWKLHFFTHPGLIPLIFNVIVLATTTALLSLFIGFNNTERVYAYNIVRSKLHRP